MFSALGFPPVYVAFTGLSRPTGSYPALGALWRGVHFRARGLLRYFCKRGHVVVESKTASFERIMRVAALGSVTRITFGITYGACGKGLALERLYLRNNPYKRQAIVWAGIECALDPWIGDHVVQGRLADDTPFTATMTIDSYAGDWESADPVDPPRLFGSFPVTSSGHSRPPTVRPSICTTPIARDEQGPGFAEVSRRGRYASLAPLPRPAWTSRHSACVRADSRAAAPSGEWGRVSPVVLIRARRCIPAATAPPARRASPSRVTVIAFEYALVAQARPSRSGDLRVCGAGAGDRVRSDGSGGQRGHGDQHGRHDREQRHRRRE